MQHCPNCGMQMPIGSTFCTNCRHSLRTRDTISRAKAEQLLSTLSRRLNTEGIFWLIIAVIQIVLGLNFNWITLIIGFDFNWPLLIIGALNLVCAIQEMKQSQKVMQSPIGIVDSFDSLVSPIIMLIYNLIWGRFIGVLASIYYLVAVRGFVMENRFNFIAIEKAYLKRTNGIK